MKKLIVLMAGFFLSTGVALANSSDYDCSGDDVKPVTLSVNQQG